MYTKEEYLVLLNDEQKKFIDKLNLEFVAYSDCDIDDEQKFELMEWFDDEPIWNWFGPTIESVFEQARKDLIK